MTTKHLATSVLLFFSEDPERWFAGAKIEVAQFAGDRAGTVQAERSLSRPAG